VFAPLAPRSAEQFYFDGLSRCRVKSSSMLRLLLAGLLPHPGCGSYNLRDERRPELGAVFAERDKAGDRLCSTGWVGCSISCGGKVLLGTCERAQLVNEVATELLDEMWREQRG
jgi:hypothetical protein